MRTVLITGGTDGIGKGVAMNQLKQGNRVIVVGNSKQRGEIFLNETLESGFAERAVFIQADLSLVSENERLIREVTTRFGTLDAVVFCATLHNYRPEYSDTIEGFEHAFALNYLSRFVLSFGLKDVLTKSENPVIINVCGSGMKGEVRWDDLQYKKDFDSIKTQRHSSRLNDLLGVAFSMNGGGDKIKYVLFNPWAVQTKGAFKEQKSPLVNAIVKFIYKLIGKPVEKAILPIIDLLNSPPISPLTSFTQRKENSLSMETFDRENAHRLFQITTRLLKGVTITS